MIPLVQVALLRLVRDRTNIFFVIVFPLLLVVLIGLSFGGGQDPVSVAVAAEDEVGEKVAAELENAGFDVRTTDESTARRAVSAGTDDAAVIVPAVDPESQAPVVVELVAVADGSEQALRTTVAAAVTTVVEPIRIIRVLATVGIDAAPADVAGLGDEVELQSTVVDAAPEDELFAEFQGLGQFDIGASSQLLLFVFITALTSAAGVVQARRWGVLDRIVAGPTRPSSVVAGLALGQFVVALLQAAVIIVVTALVFDVEWGDPIGTGAVILLFSAVAAAGGLLIGAVLDNEEQVGGVAVPVALVLAALGGSMLPLELFPQWLLPVANLTPHAWANRAFAETVRRGGGITDVLPNLAMLALFTVVLGVAATMLLRRRITRD